MRVVNVHVQGGLGNRLFQALRARASTQIRRRVPHLVRFWNPHSALDYFDGILAQFRPFVKPAGRIDRVISERPDDAGDGSRTGVRSRPE